MVEPIGITGTSITIVGLLYNTCQAVCNIISSYKKAPKEYQDLRIGFQNLQDALGSLKESLSSVQSSTLSPEQQDSLAEIERPLATCSVACESFQAELSNVASHSTQDQTAFWDRLCLRFNESDVAFLQDKLISTKATILVALGVLNLSASETSAQY
ncbi:hypothetical protein TruAng_008088 [Truncatella angustata]|nr:hypothetical protein TruAng_008088 [Truncatella angustata]